MIKIGKNILRLISRRFWGVVFTAIIALAVCVQLGRQAFPLINDYKSEITQFVGKRVGLTIAVDSVDARWDGLRPKLSLNNVVAHSKTGEQVFKIGNASVELGLIDSLLHWQLKWRQLKFDSFDATLVQTSKGWEVPGLPKFKKDAPETQEEKLQINDPYDVFLFGRRVRVSDANFGLQFETGETSIIQIPSISLENDRNFHRLAARIDLDDGGNVFSLIVEGHGDPRQSDFVANGFLNLRQFPSQKIFDALALSKIKQKNEDLMVDMSLWFSGGVRKGTSFRGELGVHGQLGIEGKDFKFPNSINTQIAGHIGKDNTWRADLKNLVMGWEERQSPSTDVTLMGDFSGKLEARIQQLQVDDWIDIMLHVGLGNQKAEKNVADLNPSGQLKNIAFKLTDKENDYFFVSAQIVNGAGDAVMGSPAVKNINGNIFASATSGWVDVDVNDGFSMFFPRVYHEALEFKEAKGQVRWSLDVNKHFAYLSSGLLHLKSDDEEGVGYIKLSLPFSEKRGNPSMTLAVGVEKSLAKSHEKYVPKTIPKTLYKWLSTSIKTGNVANARFLFHGSLEKDPDISPVLQLYGEVYDGSIAFDPAWPQLENVNGSITLENDKLDVRIDHASVLGNAVYDAKVNLIADPASGPENKALSIRGSLASDVDTAMHLLKNSPIKKHIGSTFDDWEFSGGVSASVELIVPLSAESGGLSHKIDVLLNKANTYIPDLELNIENISGEIVYESSNGMYSDNFVAEVWGESFSGSIVSPKNKYDEFDTEIRFVGSSAITDLKAWTRRPELLFASGKANIDGSLLIPSESNPSALEIKVHSDLAGVAVDLPLPYAKPADTAANFLTKISFYDNEEQEYQFRYENSLQFNMLSSSDGLTSALIQLGSVPESEVERGGIPKTGRFDIVGSLSYFDLEDWMLAKDKYFEEVEKFEIVGESSGNEAIAVSFDFVVDTFLLGAFDIKNISVKGERATPFWNLRVDSELMAGQIVVPEDERPLRMYLDYIRIVNEEYMAAMESTGQPPPGYEKSVLAEFDLTRAIAIDFKTDEFLLNEESYGAWSFNLRPIQNGLVLQNIVADTKGMHIGGEQAGSSFLWRRDDATKKDFSQFRGEISAKNLANVFDAWGQEKLLESKEATFKIDAVWSGAPDEISLAALRGVVGIDILNGSFSRGAGSDENTFLRLLALFNFDTILRRLRLDFSDLASEGYAFDRVNGKFEFKGGVIFLTEPVIVESSSSYVQLAGTIDLLNETLDSEMVVTLPMASNMAVATAVVVGLPAALGVYVMSKLFKRQVDRASSLNMVVKGDWEDPKVKIKKIFDIDAANRRGKEVKEEKKAELK